MKQWIYMFFIFTMIVCVGCATVKSSPKVAPQPAVTTTDTGTATASGSAVSESTGTKLPSSYTTITQSSIRARQVATVYRQVPSLKTVRSINPVILKEINEKSSLAGGMVSRCDFDVIKALVAAGWTPAVLLRIPTGSIQMRTVLGYNDPPEELILADPNDLELSRQLKIGYADFLKTWDDPQKTCLLVFPQFVDEQIIKNALLRFLPREKVDSVVIKSKVGGK